MTHHPEREFDQWLGERQRGLSDSLDAVLNLHSGLRDALLPDRRADLDRALSNAVDPGAGLAAILTSRPETAPRAPAAGGPDGGDLTAYSLALMARPEQTRLALRARIPYNELNEIDSELSWQTTFRELADDLKAIHESLQLKNPVEPELRRQALDLLKTSVKAVDQYRIAPRYGPLNGLVLRDNEKLAYARRLASTWINLIEADRLHDTRLDFIARRFESAVDAGLSIMHAFSRVDRVDIDLAEALKNELRRLRERGADGRFSSSITKAVNRIRRATTDFTGADLASADLTDIPLVGVRWSAATRWPAEWAEHVRRNSTEIKPGVFEIRRRPRNLSHSTL
ncbi:hypothetical protein [Amycolatopsis dendrobii]|uniref:Uncharacterized protein n=1 Tax=Amycolatopsis dendrobii TaxID=2760662 RepID=A0A7W3VX44_9PSEU|nr:hypothetical protein [Amycolatopsis dendrobii]MBB1154357.1 hypothetical protein [Amycolatopsis dendrobii]